MKNFYSTPRDQVARQSRNRHFATICLLVAALVVMTLVVLLASIFFTGGGWLSWNLFTANHLEDNPEESGILQAILGSIALCLLCAITALPIGIGTAVWDFGRHGFCLHVQLLPSDYCEHPTGIRSRGHLSFTR